MTDHKKNIVERFKKYIKINTQSANGVESFPSTPKQLELGKMVADDLKAAGLTDAICTEEGFVLATIHGNVPNVDKVPVLGFLGHLDVSPDSPADNIKLRLIENYQGGEIKFPANPDVKLDYNNAPGLKKCIGHTIMTSDGTTLLSIDDKAALAVLVELAHYYKENPKEPHGNIRIAIIPDEEIGVGTEKLSLKQFGADIAYTLDGGALGEIDVESFNGFMGKIEVEGYVSFPGYGKGVYLSSIQVLSKFISSMQMDRWPQNCDKRQSIWWVDDIKGGVGKTSASIYLRAFDLKDIEEMKKVLNGIKENILKEFPKAKINININETYLNYKKELDKDPRVVKYAEEAMKRIGIEPIHKYVRGGNDSCHLCRSGLISTNLFIGMNDMHSVIEWGTVETIYNAFRTSISLAKVWSETTK
jgi:tripeptide aminopeptidase